eukprot:4589782-Pleurochrysis_carterae.AAC.1
MSCLVASGAACTCGGPLNTDADGTLTGMKAKKRSVKRILSVSAIEPSSSKWMPTHRRHAPRPSSSGLRISSCANSEPSRRWLRSLSWHGGALGRHALQEAAIAAQDLRARVARHLAEAVVGVDDRHSGQRHVGQRQRERQVRRRGEEGEKPAMHVWPRLVLVPQLSSKTLVAGATILGLAAASLAFIRPLATRCTPTRVPCTPTRVPFCFRCLSRFGRFRAGSCRLCSHRRRRVGLDCSDGLQMDVSERLHASHRQHRQGAQDPHRAVERLLHRRVAQPRLERRGVSREVTTVDGVRRLAQDEECKVLCAERAGRAVGLVLAQPE